MLVTEPRQLDRLLAELGDAEAYALDTEFHREGFYYPRPGIVQLAGPGIVAVVDVTAVDIQAMRPLLEGPGLAVGHALEQDLEVLDRACGALPSRIFDTQIAAGFLGHGSPSLVALVRDVLGRRMLKGPRMSDWFRRPLSADQLRYAEADVADLLELRETIEARLAAAGHLEWAREESELHRRLRKPDVATVWWRLKGSRNLKGSARGVAQEVAAWRERKAMATDRPARSILPDEAISTLAERPNPSTGDLATSRLFDPRRLKPGEADELIAAAVRGAGLSPAELRLPPSDDLPVHLQPLATLIAAWVAQLSRDLAIEASLLATRSDIEAFLRNDPRTRISQGWRAELVGETVGQIAAGRAAVAYNGAGALVIVDR